MLRRLLLLLAFCSCAPEPAEVRVFAAASLTDALTEIGRNYERATGQRVVFNFAASSTLARQIRSGAPADLFLSADEARMDMVETVERVSVLSNTLVIVGEGIASPRDLIGKSVALAEPSSVPAGVYAREYLTRIGLWDEVAPNVVPTENVRAALAVVRSGNVDAAIVYKTDAAGLEIKDGPKISYPFGLLRDTQNSTKFFRYLQSRPALDVFKKHGFLTQ